MTAATEDRLPVPARTLNTATVPAQPVPPPPMPPPTVQTPAVQTHPGGAYRAFASVSMKMSGIDGVIIDGDVLQAEPPRRLVQTWHVLLDAATRAEAGTRLTWDIEEGHGGISTLTLTHDMTGAPSAAALAQGRHPAAGGGWAWILSDLKTLLETGRPLAA